jgi:hypothetical protein
LINNEVAFQVMGTIKEKTEQALTQIVELKENFQTITQEIEENQKE